MANAQTKQHRRAAIGGRCESVAGILLSPAVGAVLMSLSAIVVAINAQLLRRVNMS